MTIKYRKKISHLIGSVGVEDAEVLFNWLQENRKCKLNLAKCEHLHTSVLQLMIFIKSNISVWPENQALAQLLKNALH